MDLFIIFINSTILIIVGCILIIAVAIIGYLYQSISTNTNTDTDISPSAMTDSEYSDAVRESIGVMDKALELALFGMYVDMELLDFEIQYEAISNRISKILDDEVYRLDIIKSYSDYMDTDKGEFDDNSYDN